MYNSKGRNQERLKLLSMFAAWPFWTFHNKSHNIKALVILRHSWSPFLPLTCLYGKNELLLASVQHSGVFSREKTLHKLSMKITWPWPSVARFSHGLITVRQQKCEHKVVILVWQFDCLHFTQYMPMSPHDIGNKHTCYPPDVR